MRLVAMFKRLPSLTRPDFESCLLPPAAAEVDL